MQNQHQSRHYQAGSGHPKELFGQGFMLGNGRFWNYGFHLFFFALTGIQSDETSSEHGRQQQDNGEPGACPEASRPQGPGEDDHDDWQHQGQPEGNVHESRVQRYGCQFFSPSNGFAFENTNDGTLRWSVPAVIERA
jgi:hypothetical protein